MNTPKRAVYENKDSYQAARAIHELCQELKKTKMTKEQRMLVSDIDGEAFRIYTNPKVPI